MGLLYGENCMILTSTIFEGSTRVTDGRERDGQTDGIAIAYARLAYMLSHAKNVQVHVQQTTSNIIQNHHA